MGEFSAQVYQYEPEFTEEVLESIVSQPQNGMTELERIFDLTWCKCGVCMIMSSSRESICCQEFETLYGRISVTVCKTCNSTSGF